MVGFDTKNKTISVLVDSKESNLEIPNSLQESVRRTFKSASVAQDSGAGYLYSGAGRMISDHSLRKADRFISDGVLKLVSSGEFVTDQISEVECLDYTEEMYDVVNTDDELCVYNSFLTHNCSEGNYTGGWTEKNI